MFAGILNYIHTVSALLYESQHQTPECCLLAHAEGRPLNHDPF